MAKKSGAVQPTGLSRQPDTRYSRPMPPDIETTTLTLPTTALMSLRQRWEHGDADDRIVDAVRVLLGGQDGTLSVINAALGPSGWV